MRKGSRVRLFTLMLAASVVGCSSSSGPDQAPGGSDSGPGPGQPDSSGPVGPALAYDGGCITYAGAAKFCGDGTPGTICGFAAQCSGSNAGQCVINCAMNAGYVGCYGPSVVACLQNAFTAQDCAAFSKCGWL
jgi:hypothetical protein